MGHMEMTARAFKELAEHVNEASRAHAMNYTGLLHALLSKGVLSPEEVEAGRERVKPIVDERFGPHPEEKRAAELAKLLQFFGRVERDTPPAVTQESK